MYFRKLSPSFEDKVDIFESTKVLSKVVVLSYESTFVSDIGTVRVELSIIRPGITKVKLIFAAGKKKDSPGAKSATVSYYLPSLVRISIQYVYDRVCSYVQ